ncbi:MAG TPA: hypothetical protein VK828_06260 [Terriglobales bacterium]|jgi:hypothetical protein|nr:hypothetical protein [Terriglobales bacterium]
MDARRRGILILGWLAVVAGYGLALVLIRGIFIGVTGGFGAGRPQAIWLLFGYLLFFAVAVYLFNLGRRAISFANGNPRPKAQFGWGRILLGSIFLYSSAVDHFHIFPAGRFKHLEPTNHTQAVTMKVTALVIALGCILLIFSGMWRGIRPHRTSVSA